MKRNLHIQFKAHSPQKKNCIPANKQYTVLEHFQQISQQRITLQII